MGHPVLIDVDKVEAEIRSQIAQLQVRLSFVLEMKARYAEPVASTAGFAETDIPAPRRAIGPLEAVRRIFDRVPEKHWPPQEITAHLEDLRGRNLLTAKTPKLSNSTHTALKSLRDSGYITRHEKDGPAGLPTYSKASRETKAQ